jgi:hypothetical protein
METKLNQAHDEEIVELTLDVLALVGGGINPQPLPPKPE